MKMMCRLLTAFLAALVLCNSVHAGQALPVSTVQRTLSSVIQQKMFKRGFSANDPRFGQTLDLVSGGTATVAGAAAAAVVAGSITAPAWVSVALAAGVGAVVTAFVGVAVNGLVDWLFSPDPNDPTPITQKKTLGATIPSGTGGLISGGPYWKTGIYMASDAMSTIQAAFADTYNSTYINFTSYSFYLDGCGADSPNTYNCVVKRASKTDGSTTDYSNFRSYYYSSGAPRTCPEGQVSNSATCVSPQAVPDSSPAEQKLALQKAIANLSPDELSKPLNPQIVAPLADKLWRDAAARPGYGGIPYLATDPITAEDAESVRQANPQNWPTVQDFIAPQPNENFPWKLPGDPAATTQDPTASTSPTTNPASNTQQVNLGPDPGIGSPVLEATPTAQQILQPVLDLLPDFRSFVTPSHQSACPKPQFDVFGKIVTMDAHCTISEEQRTALQAVMAAVWILAAVFIILRA